MQQEFAFINFFRALAAYWVLASHCMIWGGAKDEAIPDPKLAVDLFMLISGYLMAANSSFNRKKEPLTVIRNWYRFWLKRFFRIAPAYYLSLLMAVTFSVYFLAGYSELQELNPGRWHEGGVYDPDRINYSLTNILLHLTFVFGLHPAYSFSTFLPDWSLSLEMQFYLVFPVLFVLMTKIGFLRFSIALVIPAFLTGYYVNMYFVFFEPSFLLMKLNYFVAGILGFIFFDNMQISRMSFRVKLSQCLIVVVVLCFVSLDYMRYDMDIIILWVLSLFFLAFAALDAMKLTPSSVSRIFGSTLTRFASDCSYSVYLFHGFFISMFGLLIGNINWLAEMDLNKRLFFMVFFVSLMSYGFAYVIYKVIELKGIQLGKHLINKCVPQR